MSLQPDVPLPHAYSERHEPDVSLSTRLLCELTRVWPSYVLPQAYAGGNAKLVERCFGVSGPETLYVGDHLFTDVNMAKRGLSWRTCLILQARAISRNLPG